jgi:hypothetical protein
MATAVFLDAVVIRSILMRAVLELFGQGGPAIEPVLQPARAFDEAAWTLVSRSAYKRGFWLQSLGDTSCTFSQPTEIRDDLPVPADPDHASRRARVRGA